MDLWVVAAATGAGYLAKYWQNQSKEGDALSEFSFEDSNLVSSENSNHLLNKFAPRKKQYEDVLDIASMNGFENEKLGISGNYQDFDVLSSSNMSRKFWINENYNEYIGGSNISGKMADDFGISVRNSSRRIGSVHGLRRNRRVGSMNSLQDCLLMAHGVKERKKMEDRDPSSLLSPTSSEVEIDTASRNSGIPFTVVGENKFPKGSHFDEIDNVCGVSSLYFDRVDNKTGKSRERISRSSSKMANKKLFNGKGSLDESFILCLGFFAGMISSFVTHQKEVHKLKELLNQTENLVRDLQEELEMKDSLEVQEIINDNCESQYTFSNAFSEKTGDESTSKHIVDYSMNFNVEGLYEQKDKSSESMSRIEAELEAELERMGLNINTHSMENFYGMDELDPEFIEDLAEGELKNDIISRQNSSWEKPNQEGSNSTAHSGNYAVSPRELSLRLHEVIQSKLEARVEELEIALQNNQRKLQFINTEYKNSWLELEDDEMQESSSNEKSLTESLVMDFSEEAINGFHCSHEQLTKVHGSEEGNLPSWGSLS